MIFKKQVAIITSKSEDQHNYLFLADVGWKGDLFKIKSVKAHGNDILKDEYLTERVPIKPGDLYSRKQIIDAIKALELLWGDLGYIFVHIEPSIQPNDDDNTRRHAAARRQSLIALVVVVVLFAVGWLLARELYSNQKVEECVLSGRTNCVPIDTHSSSY